MTGCRPILRRLCDCFRRGASRKRTGYGARRLCIIAARKRDSRFRTDPMNAKPVIWRHASVGRNLPSTISGLNTIEARKSLFRKRETLSFMTEYSRTESTIIWGSSLRNGSIRLLPRKEILTTSPESLSDQSTDISGRIFEFRMDINTVRQSDRFKFAEISISVLCNSIINQNVLIREDYNCFRIH